MHNIIAKSSISRRGNRVFIDILECNSNGYPQEAGKSFPISSNEEGSRFIGNIIPDRRIEGKK